MYIIEVINVMQIFDWKYQSNMDISINNGNYDKVKCIRKIIASESTESIWVNSNSIVKYQ